MPIPSRAASRFAEGVTTRGIPLHKRCSLHEPPARFVRDEIVSSVGNTTYRRRIKSLCAKTRNNNALLKRLKKRGNVRTASGGNVIIEEIMYGDSSTDNASSYSGYEVIDITPNSPISAGEFNWKQYAAAVS